MARDEESSQLTQSSALSALLALRLPSPHRVDGAGELGEKPCNAFILFSERPP
jgi:hypothetical protein